MPNTFFHDLQAGCTEILAIFILDRTEASKTQETPRQNWGIP